MFEKQKLENISKEELVPRVKGLHDSGHRLVQICCTKMDQLEVNYSFDKDYDFINLRILLPTDGTELISISKIYWNAFIYENEIHDLFGITVKGMAIDYEGNLYRTKVKWPFRTEEKETGGSDG